MKHFTTLILVLLLMHNFWSQDRKFQVNGAARGYLFAQKMLIDDALDSINAPRANYGHTLVDLGFSIFPNSSTEIISNFRIRNEFGGFWGGGVSFNVRQLTLNGVAGKVVKYNLGDIDVKMTPYTLYNFQEEGIVNEAEVFALRRQIVHYDMFYLPENTWRMQGAQIAFGLKFSKFLKAIEFKGFLTRQRPTNGISIPERLYGGGMVTWKQNENLQFAYNNINLFDLKETINDSIRYSNNVHSGSMKYSRPINKTLKWGLDAEAGFSNVKYSNYQSPLAPEKQNDWFYDASFNLEDKKSKIKTTIGYKDVGANFFSPGAQTKRVDFNKFPAVFQQYTNAAVGRNVTIADMMNFNAGYSYQISEQLMAYNAAYNNVNPYGIATPNRRGVYLNMEQKDSLKFKKSFVQVAQMFESRGSGTNVKKAFTSIAAGMTLGINDFFKWKREILVNFGIRHDLTNRGGEVYEKIKLSSTLIDAGLSFRLVGKLDLLMGAKYFTAKGNEFITERTVFNTVNNFLPTTIDLSETTYAAGFRYKFSEKNQLLLNYQLHQIKNNVPAGINYGISQFNILYSLNF